MSTGDKLSPTDRCPGRMRLNGTKVGMCHTCQRHTYRACTTEPPAHMVGGVWTCDEWLPHEVPQKLDKTITIRSDD